jgi:alkylated DNA repair dioxygenase AlkB
VTQLKIYCDNGACPKELKELQKRGVIELYMFPYENKNRHIKNIGLPSNCNYKDLKNFTYKTLPGTYDDYSGSDKYANIVELLGLANKRLDISHLDSAYKSQCKVFLTNDKDDIWSHKDKLEELLEFRIFCLSELDECLNYISLNKAI